MEPILTYYDWSAEVTAFSSTRHGGYSEGSYSSFNINSYCGDNPSAVLRNKEMLCRKLCIKPCDLVMPHQSHGVGVKLIGESFFNLTEKDQQAYLENVDALVTGLKGVCIGISTADCLPVLMYDAVHHATAVVHSGWRGTVAQIVAVALEALKKHFMTSPDDVKVIIGPGISRKYFEVGNEVYDAFEKAGFDMKSIAETVDSKWHIDLPKAVALTLTSRGVKEENIKDVGICTYQNVKDYFSARRLTIHSGRIFSGVILR